MSENAKAELRRDLLNLERLAQAAVTESLNSATRDELKEIVAVGLKGSFEDGVDWACDQIEHQAASQVQPFSDFLRAIALIIRSGKGDALK